MPTLRETWRNMRNYFSRSKTPEVKLNDDRGRNAQTGYLQRRSWFDKTLDFVGKALLYTGLTVTAATGIGAIALGIQYVRGGSPYREVRNNEYEITQNRITEKPTRPTEQGVNIFIPLIERLVTTGEGDNKKTVTITREIQSTETPEFSYRSSEGLQVKLNTQYNFQVATPEGAAQVYWDYGGLEKAKETLDTIVENALLNELSKVPASLIASEHRYAQAGEEITVKGEPKTAKGGEEINYLIEAEKLANIMLKKERIGIVVTNFSISNPKFTPSVEAAWEASTQADARVKLEEGEARARIVRAESEAKEAEIQRDVTMRTFGGYVDVIKNSTQLTDASQIAYLASELHRRDNAQQIASTSKGRYIHIDNSSTGPIQSPIINQILGSLSRTVSTQ